MWQILDAVDTVVCAADDGWKYHSKHVEQFPGINKQCNVACCWIYEYTGILLGAHLILHISRIRVNFPVTNINDDNYEYNQRDATIYGNLLFLISSKCFERNFCSSLEVPDCI
jgi:hypothetical protein